MDLATYLYCLVRHRERPDLSAVPEGLPGAAPPRLLEIEPGLWLVAADVPLPAYGEAEIGARLEDLAWVSDRALAHEAVVEHFAEVEALVPMKLFTLFAGDARAVAHARSELPALRSALDRVSGRLEWGVRLRHDPAQAAVMADAAPAASGREFLARKRELRDAARRAPAAAREEAERIYRDLAARAAESRRRPPEGGTPLVLDAAFLVDRVDRDCFVEAVDAAARELADLGYELTLTGPWPPYNFIGEPA